MTPRAYEAAKALSRDPGATQPERDTAALRVREYEDRHGKPAAQAPASPFRPWHRPSPAAEHDMRDLCATCGKDWALHWIAQNIDITHPEARPCSAFVPKMKPPRRKPRLSVEPVPWWTLDVRNAAGTRLGLTYAFRTALRWLRAEIDQPRERSPWTLYLYAPETVEYIERGEVAWRWFPDLKEERDGGRGSPWRPPAEMRAAMKAHKERR